MGLSRYKTVLSEAGIEIPKNLSNEKKDMIEVGLDLRELRSEDVVKIINAKSTIDAQRILTTNRQNDVYCSLEPLQRGQETVEMDEEREI